MERRPGSLFVLVVCDGNVCRSPSAQFELQRRMPTARVESAGMHAVAGMALCALATEEIASGSVRTAGGEAAGEFAATFRSRTLRDVDVDGFDLVLAATTSIRSDLARAHPELRDRFFTFLEAVDVLADLLRTDGADQPLTPAELVERMNEHRGAPPAIERLSPKLRLKTADALDIPDAHAERAKRHRAVVDLARESAAALGDSLARLTIK